MMKDLIASTCLAIWLQSAVLTGAAEHDEMDRSRQLHSAQRSLQTASERICEQLLEKHQWGCSCRDVLEESDNGNNNNNNNTRVAFDCPMCGICDLQTDNEICVEADYNHIIEDGGSLVTHRTKFQYTGERNNQTDEILLAQECSMDEELTLTCTSCVATVNDEPCNSCEMPSCDKDSVLPFTSIPKFDCSNIEEGAVYDPCIDSRRDPQTEPGDLLFGPDLAIENCLRTVSPDSLSTEVTAKCSAATKLGVGADTSANYFDELVEARDICNEFGYYSSAKFYEVTGNGNIFTVSTCRDGTNRRAVLSVFSGGCDNLQCTVGQSHQDPLCGDDDSFLRYNSDQVSWKTEPDEVYYVVVMVIEAGDVQVGLTETAPSTNTECETADMDTLVSNQAPVIGNTVDGGTGPSCDLFFEGEEATGRGVWYEILPEQDSQTVFVASTCSNTTTNFFAEVRVFYGACGNLTCIESYEYENCDQDSYGSRIIWPSISEADSYFLYVTSTVFGERFDAGNFVLELTESEIAANSFCTDAIPVNISGEKTLGSTLAAGDGGFLPSLLVESEFLLVAQAGLWYSITSDVTTTLQVSTCHEETDTDFQGVIWIYDANGTEANGTEACDGLNLVAVERSNDPECSITLGTKLTWTAGEDVEYLMYINSDTGRGGFAFSIIDVEPAANNECESADSSLSIDGPELLGSTEFATRSFPLDFTCGNRYLNSAGVWYTIQGNGNSFSATTCSANLTFAARITIFEGTSCDDLRCIDTANTESGWRCPAAPTSEFSGASSSTMNWKSEEGTTYYLYVHGESPLSIGTFGLSVIELTQTSENNFCPQAMNFTAGEQLSGSTSEAAIGLFSIEYCGGATENGGIWYEMEGTGGFIEMIGCSSGDDYSMTVSVFAGDCSNLTCVNGETFPIPCSDFDSEEASNRQLQPLEEQRELSWFAEAGVMYRFYIHGQAPNFTLDGGTGSFELITKIIPTEEPTGDPMQAPVVPVIFPADPTDPPILSPSISPITTSQTPGGTAFTPTAPDDERNLDGGSRISATVVLVSMVGAVTSLIASL